MSKIRTVSHLQDRLDKSFSWRLKEVVDLKVSVQSNSSLARTTIVRAGVPLLYAHWEGFIKEASQDYLAFVANQRLSYGELASCFVVFGAKKYLADLIGSRNAALNIEAVKFFRDGLGNRADLALASAINTQSNLSSDVFTNIALSLGVAISPYDTYFNLIDESLLARRNRIAHGEYLDLDANDFRALADEVIGLLRMFKTDLENLASLGAYRLAAA